MRVIRSAGQNVSPSDDGRLFDQIFTDGLFEETTITHLGANNVALGAMYGIICGRDFTAEAQTVAVELPEDDAGTTGYIYVEIDTSSDDVITIGTALAPFTPTYEDLNTNGAVAQMIIAEYVASSVAITSLTPNYVMATSGSVLPGSVATVETSPAVANHSVGEFILYGGQLYSVTAAISVGESLTPGTNISATSAGAELTTLKNGLTVKQTSLSNSTYLSTNIKVFRQANFVNVIYAGDAKKIDASAWIALGTLPTGYRPAEYINVLVRSTNTVWVRISTAGVIEYYTTTSASGASNFQFQVTYYTPDAMP